MSRGTFWLSLCAVLREQAWPRSWRQDIPSCSSHATHLRVHVKGKWCKPGSRGQVPWQLGQEDINDLAVGKSAHAPQPWRNRVFDAMLRVARWCQTGTCFPPLTSGSSTTALLHRRWESVKSTNSSAQNETWVVRLFCFRICAEPHEWGKAPFVEDLNKRINIAAQTDMHGWSGTPGMISWYSPALEAVRSALSAPCPLP